VLTSSTAITTSINSTPSGLKIAEMNHSTIPANHLIGYVSSFRIVKGQALTSGAFTAPAAPVTTTAVGWTGANAASSITGTVSLLLNYTNAGITDATAKNVLETVGNAQISTTQSRFGGSSIYFDGTGDYLTIAGNANLWLGAGDFTVEFWVYSPTPPSTSAAQYELVSFGTSGSTFRCFIFYASGSSTASAQFGIYSGATNIITVNSVIPQNTWTHVAVTRSGSGTGNVRFYINGTQNATTGTNTTNFNTGNLGIGATPAGTNPAFVYIDDLRITKGFARYTASFTAPTAAFPTQ
jgi:hypothetical protein